LFFQKKLKRSAAVASLLHRLCSACMLTPCHAPVAKYTRRDNGDSQIFLRIAIRTHLHYLGSSPIISG
jgi:hypothetical protein